MNTARKSGGTELLYGRRVVRLGDVASVDTGGTPRREVAEYWDGNIAWMASAKINQSRVTSTAEPSSEQRLKDSNAKIFPQGTVMVAMNGQGITRGKASVLGIECACNQSLAAIRADPASNNQFLFHLLSARYEDLRGFTREGRNGLNLDLIRGFRFLIPPFAERSAIADVLDSIDDAIERTEAVIAATETLRDSPAPRITHPRRPRLAYRLEVRARHRHHPRRLGGGAVARWRHPRWERSYSSGWQVGIYRIWDHLLEVTERPLRWPEIGRCRLHSL